MYESYIIQYDRYRTVGAGGVPIDRNRRPKACGIYTLLTLNILKNMNDFVYDLCYKLQKTFLGRNFLPFPNMSLDFSTMYRKNSNLLKYISKYLYNETLAIK